MVSQPKLEDLVMLDVPTHRYIHIPSGRTIQSVSSILRKSKVREAPFTSGVSERSDSMARALKRGTEVHRLTRAIDETGDIESAFSDTFDPADLSEENIRYVAAYENFLNASDYRPTAWEVVLYYPEFDYAGRADGVGWIGNKRVMIDRKTDQTLNRAVWLQLGLYRQAWNRWHPNAKIDQTMAVQLKADQTFTMHANPLEPGDWPFCVAALWMAKWADLKV